MLLTEKQNIDLYGEDYHSRFQHPTTNGKPTIKDLQFCFDELLGELGWCDEVAETDVDPLAWARNEIKDLHKTIKRLRGSLELRNAAEQLRAADGGWACAKCGYVNNINHGKCHSCGTRRR